MENAMMVALSRQVTLRRELSITANNLANMSTTGFKVEKLLLASNEGKTASHSDGPRKISFANDWGVARDFSDGVIENTDRPLDMALSGKGFFVVETPEGDRYTRDGRFTVDETGSLSTADGMGVLDETGAPVLLDANGGAPKIDRKGVITVDGQEVARLKIVDFDDKGALSKDGYARFVAPADAVPQIVENPTVMQGFLERSNVVPILEINRMIEVNRAYQAVSSMLKKQEDTSKQAIQRLGRVG